MQWKPFKDVLSQLSVLIQLRASIYSIHTHADAGIVMWMSSFILLFMWCGAENMMVDMTYIWRKKEKKFFNRKTLKTDGQNDWTSNSIKIQTLQESFLQGMMQTSLAGSLRLRPNVEYAITLLLLPTVLHYISFPGLFLHSSVAHFMLFGSSSRCPTLSLSPFNFIFICSLSFYLTRCPSCLSFLPSFLLSTFLSPTSSLLSSTLLL